MKLTKKTISYVIIIGLVVLVVGILMFSRDRSASVEFSSVVVERMDLTQSVAETGSVDTELEILYGWETAGQVIDIVKDVGDIVVTGDVIARLDDAQQRARLNEALSLVSSAQAKLNLEFAGPSDQEKVRLQTSIEQAEAQLAQSEAELRKTISQSSESVINAEKTLADAENDLQLANGGENSQLVNDAYEDLVNALKVVLSRLSEGITDADSVLGVDNQRANDDYDTGLAFRNKGLLVTGERSYMTAKNSFLDASSVIVPLTIFSDHALVDDAVIAAFDAIADMQQLLFDVQLVLAASDPVGGLTSSALSTLKTDINTVLASLNTASASLSDDRQAIVAARNSLSSYHIAYDKAFSNLGTARSQADANNAIARSKVSSQKAHLAQAQATYDEAVAPPRSVDIASLRADISRYNANASALRNDVEKTKLVALADGVISSLSVEPGENVTASQEVVGIISPKLSVEVDISESDIAKIDVGDVAGITLDAFGDDRVFMGEVLHIDPAETEISGVIYYKTDILFTDDDISQVRPGMTANIDIYTDERTDAIVIPRRAILTKEGKKVVRVLTDNELVLFEEREVETGLRGNDGQIEIVSGLAEGDEIITFLKEE